jgi:hypothetical protein
MDRQALCDDARAFAAPRVRFNEQGYLVFPSMISAQEPTERRAALRLFASYAMLAKGPMA